MAQLFELRSSAGKIYKIDQAWMRLGRADENNIVVRDPAVSRFHLNLYLKDGRLIVEDAGSENGFVVNGRLLKSATALNPGDRLSLGSTEFLVRLAGAVATPRDSAAPRGTPIPVAVPQGGGVPARFKLYAVVVVALGAAFVMSKQKTDAPVATEAKDALEVTEKKLTMTDDIKKFQQKSVTEIKADSKFREAKRDYDNGNYSRAILGFREALTFNPANEGATEFLSFAEEGLKKQLDALAKDSQRSFERLQYHRSKGQAQQILTILSEQIPGFVQRVLREEATPQDGGRRTASQEDTVLEIPCDKTSAVDLCKNAVSTIKRCRQLLGEEDVLK